MTKRVFILTEDDENGLSAKYHTFDEKGNLLATQDVEMDVLDSFLTDTFFPPAVAEEIEMTVNDEPVDAGTTGSPSIEIGGDAATFVGSRKKKKS